ncbi:MAG: hypothetical protein ACRD1E_09365, partial [Terriglobales bacterium]
MALVAAALGLLATVSAAASPITWTLEGVTFLNGYSATGSFILDTSKPGSIAVTHVHVDLFHSGTQFDTLTLGSYAASGFGSSNAVFLSDTSENTSVIIEQSF